MAALRRLGPLLPRLPCRPQMGWSRGFGAAAALESADYEYWENPLRVLEGTDEQRVGRGAQWVFLGSPGVGKGTYASRLARLLDVPHISMGDLLRQELAQSTVLSKEIACFVNQGQLVSDDVILSLLSRRLEQGVAAGESGFILDGFPRTRIQAEILDEVVDIDLVVNMKLREDVLLRTCLGRRVCTECGRDFNVADEVEESFRGPGICMPPLPPPAGCVSKMVPRADGAADIVRERLRVYAEQSKPVEHFYRRQGKILDFEVLGGIPETWPRLLAALELKDKEAACQQLAA